MLTQLLIRNFGLIDELSLEFNPRLNVLTGSTGAGKSIIIDGLRFALGERIGNAQIRNSAEACHVEAVFELPLSLRGHEDLKEFFADDDAALIISRQYTPDGKNKIRINGFNMTVAQLKKIGGHLMDFHGPHDHQQLLSEESHIHILDQLTDFGEWKHKYRGQFTEYGRLKQELRDLEHMARSRERDLDLLTHQVKELGQVPLTREHFDETQSAQARVDNSEKLYENAASLLAIFENEENGVADLLRKAFGPMSALQQTDENTRSLNEQLIQMQELGENFISDLRHYTDSLSFEPDEAREIAQKFDAYQTILRKYGPSLEEAAAFCEEARHKYELLKDFEHNDARLKDTIASAEAELKKTAVQLTKARKKTAEQLKKTIEKELKDLGISHVIFEARIEPSDFHGEGADRVVFYISPNAGEDLKPMSEIVSSGEAARIMLALKKALTKVDPIPVLVFDEIDAQIGGRLGTVTGSKLKELSRDRQVLLITHLPQIASFADEHFKVAKEVAKGRTSIRVTALDKDARIDELAHMMDGENKGKISLTHAQDLLAQAGNG